MGSDLISLELLQTTGSLRWPRLPAGNKGSGKPTGCSRMKRGVFCRGNEDGARSEGWVCSAGGGGVGGKWGFAGFVSAIARAEL